MTEPATFLPSRRTDLIVDRGVVEDPRTGEFFNLGAEASFLLLALDGRRTAEQLAQEFETRFRSPLDRDDLDDFLDQARSARLLDEPAPSIGYYIDLAHEAETEPLPISAPIEAESLPAHRNDLIIKPSGDEGGHVVKDPRSGQFFDLGPEESFLVIALNGQRTAKDLQEAFAARFGSELTDEDLAGFLDLAKASNFLHIDGAAMPAIRPPSKRQSILYWRVRFFDPDRLFTWLEPSLRLIWTRGFVAVSAAGVIAALFLFWSERSEFVAKFSNALTWQTFAVAWLTLIAVTTLHEFAHGLTCKHFGGEVHELGFLMMFFLPCFYCNVSDAWLFRERSRRLWVTLAGAYCDLVVWAAAVFVWRLALPGTLVAQIAWVALTVCGGRIFFNFNPLLKLDGYYLLSDAADVPNLQKRGREQWLGQVRRLLWGAPPPPPDPRRRFLLIYGGVSWLYVFAFAALMLSAIIQFGRARWGAWAIVVVGLLGWRVGRSMFTGISAGEVTAMLFRRRKRLAIWLVILGALVAAGSLIEIERTANGAFSVRPQLRAEIHAPVAGFLREVPFDEGERVSPGGLVARLDVPDLPSKLAQKRIEVEESTARLSRVRMDLAEAQTESIRAKRLFQLSAMPEADYRAALHKLDVTSAEREASQARLQRAKEEVKFLEATTEKLVVSSPVPGIIITPHLKEKLGQYFKEGDLICTIEEPKDLLAEIKLPEQDLQHVRPGQRIEFKARALPFEIFVGVVDRTAPAAVAGEVQGTMTIYCRFEAGHEGLCSGMSGQARILCGKQPIGRVLGEKLFRLVRTEFWW